MDAIEFPAEKDCPWPVRRQPRQHVMRAHSKRMKQNGERESEVLVWVRDLQAGIAVEENSRRIFVRYFPWVRGFFGRRGFPPREAEDLAQDTLFQVFREISQFCERSTFEAWLFAVAANVWRNELRRRRTNKRRGEEVSLEPESREDGSGGASEIADEGRSPERAIFEKERQAALWAAVGRLPPQMRKCLILRLDRELKYREIAVLLKLNIDTVKAHLFHARQRLKEELGDDFADWND